MPGKQSESFLGGSVGGSSTTFSSLAGLVAPPDFLGALDFTVHPSSLKATHLDGDCTVPDPKAPSHYFKCACSCKSGAETVFPPLYFVTYALNGVG